MTISSPKSGFYELVDPADLFRVFGFFKTSARIPLNIRATIYPRALPRIMEALRLLGEAVREVGETSGNIRGHGTEFLWVRE